MGLLDSFEKGLERAVNSAFAKTFRSGIQPVEIASALRSELDKKAAVVSRDRILAPNTFTVRLSPADQEKMAALGGALGEELDTLVQRHAKAQGYSFAGPVSITVQRDDQLSTGTLRVDSSTAQGKIAWRGVLDVEGKRHPIVKARTVIGRGSDADITISDAGTSRKHVEILWDGERAMVRDMNSTNGTMLNGSKVVEAALPPDSTVTIGRTDIVFRVVAQAAPPKPPLPTLPPDDATRVFDYRDGGPLRMSELTLLLLRIGFLVLLWFFVFAVVYSLRADLFGVKVRRMPDAAAAAAAAAAPTPAAASRSAATAPVAAPPVVPSGPKGGPATTSTVSRIVITSGPKAGLELPLGNEPLTIGRSSESGLVIRDDYTSSHHARLVLWGEQWMIQDLDSTNGTWHDGTRVAAPAPVTVGAPIKVGATTFELRK